MAKRSNNACAVLFIQSAGNTCLPASLVALAIDSSSISDIFTAERLPFTSLRRVSISLHLQRR